MAKLIVYLDQSFVSGMGKRKPPRMVSLYELLARLVNEDKVICPYSIMHDQETDETLARLRAFLHRLGRHAQQGEVGIVFDGQYYGITEYDEGE